MAYLSRLIIAFLLVLPSVSSADTYYWPFGDKWFPDAVSACKQNYPGATNFAYPVLYNDGANAQCFWYGMTGGVQNTYGEQSGADVSRGTCPGSKIPDFVNKVCIDPPPAPECSENQELDTETNTCVCKTGPAGAFSVAGDVYTGCNDGCTIVLTSGSYSGTTKKTYGNWNQNGNTCSPAPETPGVDSPDSPDGQDAGKCPTGQCPGTINGTSVCVPCKGKEGSDSSSSENTTDTPSGASAPSGSSSSSSSGSKSTECEGGVCVTKEKVVVTNPDGSTTEKQKETTESIGDFCSKNPKAAICKASEEGQWGGSCGNFVCSGDAVQCAQAKEAAALRCALTVDPGSPLVAAGQAAVTGASGVTTFGVSVPGFDATNPYSGTCPVDVHVSVSGMSFTIPLSQTCPYIQFVGWCLVAAASLAGARVAFT